VSFEVKSYNKGPGALCTSSVFVKLSLSLLGKVGLPSEATPQSDVMVCSTLLVRNVSMSRVRSMTYVSGVLFARSNCVIRCKSYIK
jgi:hypothetical protein